MSGKRPGRRATSVSKAQACETEEGINLEHWYAYHSDNVMRDTYLSAGRPGMYIGRVPSTLEPNDIIWVVEGDRSRPMSFALVDCFVYNDFEDPPFPLDYSRFKLRLLGSHSLIKAAFPLSKSDPWFIVACINSHTLRMLGTKVSIQLFA